MRKKWTIMQRIEVKALFITMFLGALLIVNASCSKDDDPIDETNTEDPITDESEYLISGEPFTDPKHNIDQAISDEAQKNTMAFDAIGFYNGNLGAQTFLPPGKVADYSGFQYFRDNDQTNLGHNTSFVSIIAINMLNILSDEQIQMYIDAANDQIEMINEYAYKRFELCKAFRRLLDNDLPEGTTGLSKSAIMDYSADLYIIDGEISYNRAKLFGEVINSLSVEQKIEIKELYDLQGIGNWPSTLTDPLKEKNLDKDINVAVMTYASEMYTWYAGSTTGDVYFCPERQGTYFGSFYIKDWPAMGNPDYTIDEQLTASSGKMFLEILSTEQNTTFLSLLDLQRNAIEGIVNSRTSVSAELRKFLDGETASSETVETLSEQYGEFDGELIYYYGTYFAKIYHSLTDDQKEKITDLGNDLGYVEPTGAFLYSEPIAMPEIDNTDFLFE